MVVSHRTKYCVNPVLKSSFSRRVKAKGEDWRNGGTIAKFPYRIFCKAKRREESIALSSGCMKFDALNGMYLVGLLTLTRRTLH